MRLSKGVFAAVLTMSCVVWVPHTTAAPDPPVTLPENLPSGRSTLNAASAAAQHAARPNPANTFAIGKHGPWCLHANAGELLIWHTRRRSVRMKLSETSNGWLNLETTTGQHVLWTHGLFAPQNFAMNPPARCRGRRLQGAHQYGTWKIRIQRQTLEIHHDRNTHIVELDTRSRGHVVITSLPNGTQRIQPGDTL